MQTLVCAAAVCAACSRTPRQSAVHSMPVAAAPVQSDDPSACKLPASLPPELVLRVSRSIVPHGRDIQHLANEVTTSGPCTPGVLCKHVPSTQLELLFKLVQTATKVRHVQQNASPHYGSDFITARFAGGQCEVGDSTFAQVVPEDRQIFYDAFNAIVAASAESKDAGP